MQSDRTVSPRPLVSNRTTNKSKTALCFSTVLFCRLRQKRMHCNSSKMISFKRSFDSYRLSTGWLNALAYPSGRNLDCRLTLSIYISLYQQNKGRRNNQKFSSKDRTVALIHIFSLYSRVERTPQNRREGPGRQGNCLGVDGEKRKARATHFHMHDACMSLLLV